MGLNTNPLKNPLSIKLLVSRINQLDLTGICNFYEVGDLYLYGMNNTIQIQTNIIKNKKLIYEMQVPPCKISMITNFHEMKFQEFCRSYVVDLILILIRINNTVQKISIHLRKHSYLNFREKCKNPASYFHILFL